MVSISLKSITLYDQVLSDHLEVPLAKFITADANNCGYYVTAHDLIVNYIHPLFLQSKTDARKEDNNN